MISEATLEQLARLGEEIKRDGTVVKQRSVDICWHWWHVGRTLVSDPELYVKGTSTISVETTIRICEALGVSTKMNETRNRPYGETSVKRAIDVYNRFPDEQDAKDAIEKAGTYYQLLAGSSYRSLYVNRTLAAPAALMHLIEAETGVTGQPARQHIVAYLRLQDIKEDIVEYIRQEQGSA
jgi:hypothetical protein